MQRFAPMFLDAALALACCVLATAGNCAGDRESAGPPPMQAPMQEPGQAPGERITTFHESFDRMPISTSFRYELADASRIEIVEKPARRGAGALRVRVQPEDRVAAKNRAELKLFPNDPEQSEGWYGWSFLVPDDYAEAPREDMFQILGQWHDQPPAGKKWKDYASHPPVLAVRYGTRDGRRGIEITYGLAGGNKGVIARTPIEKGKWIDLVFHVRWSQKSDGFVEVFKDGAPLTPGGKDGHKVFGANMYNASPNYLKLGLYRQDGFETTNSVLYDELRLGPSRTDVEPR